MIQYPTFPVKARKKIIPGIARWESDDVKIRSGADPEVNRRMWPKPCCRSPKQIYQFGVHRRCCRTAPSTQPADLRQTKKGRAGAHPFFNRENRCRKINCR
ncbi:MAG: hypothetical protein CSA23_00955 [Deltaproteobacteria bacterium]|nr:MAG: hypothetical protein CSA23_00955 [Deltaproteobacteria bacterium]